MIKAFLGAIAVLLVAAGTAAGPVSRFVPARPPARFQRPAPAQPGALAQPPAEGRSSTPAIFALPELGSAGFRCGRRWAVEPFFDMRLSLATEGVTIRAGAVARRNFTYKVVGRIHGKPLLEEQFSRAGVLALPFGHYRSVTFRVRQSTEPREIDATITADFGLCYVRRWSVQMDVSPY
jgi:hypothetical protein